MSKILIVDDDEGILEAISLSLEKEGYTAITASKGKEVMEKIKSEKPDLLLLDVLLSGSDGREICQRIKKTEKGKKLPVILISAHPTIEKSSQECGADSFLAKPFDAKDLLLVIEKYLPKETKVSRSVLV
ncbi:response regulator [Candidatus Microgenomates bacterium]|nr:response regulator [Candidatus Microgenomates bacterium]